MTETIVNFFRELINNDYATIVVIAIIPIIELRGAIPVGVSMGVNAFASYGLAFVGSSLVVPFLLLLLRPLLNALKKVKFFKHFANAVEGVFKDKADKINLESSPLSDRKKEWKKILGVFLFVALPVPLTGVWTGSAVAAFLDLKFSRALPAILLGNLTAGLIMTLLSVFLQQYIDIILAVFLVLFVVLLCFFIIKVIIRTYKESKKSKIDFDENIDENKEEK